LSLELSTNDNYKQNTFKKIRPSSICKEFRTHSSALYKFKNTILWQRSEWNRP